MATKFKDSRFFFWLAVMAVVGGALVLLVTRKWGLGVTAGSVSYVEVARNFISGLGFSTFSRGGTMEPLVSYPPGFPFVLSWGWFLGLDAFHWARLLNAFFFGINIFLAGVLAWSWSKNKIAGVIAAGLFLVSPQLFEIHLHLLSEPAFFVFLLIFFIALSRYDEEGDKKMFYAAAFSAALAGLIKPVEMVFVVTAWAVFFSGKSDRLKEKGFKASLFLLIALSFPVIWYVRNILLGGITWGLYPFSLEKIYMSLDTFSVWLMPLVVPAELRWAVMGLAIGGVIALWRWSTKSAGQKATTATGICAAFLFMLAYLLSCLFVMTFVSPVMMVGNPLFSPVLVLALIVLACMTVRADPKKITVAVVILFALVSFARCVKLATVFFRDGYGYSSKAWTESKVLRELRAVDERVVVYANDPEAVYYLIGRPAIRIPDLREDDRFFPSISAVVKMFEERVAVGVVFDEKAFHPAPLWPHLRRTAVLQNAMSDRIATIYVQKKAKGAEKATIKTGAPQK